MDIDALLEAFQGNIYSYLNKGYVFVNDFEMCCYALKECLNAC